MKLNRFIALGAIALLVVGAMGALSMKVLAQSNHSNSAQAQTCDQQDDDVAEVQDAADSDSVDLQCGDQAEANGQESLDAADTDNVEEQAGDQNSPDSGEEAPEVQAPVAP